MVFEIEPYGDGTIEAALEDWRPFDEDQYSIVPVIIDAIRTILSEKSKFELESSKGQIKLKDEIAIQLNEEILRRPRVKKVYFEPFTIQ